MVTLVKFAASGTFISQCPQTESLVSGAIVSVFNPENLALVASGTTNGLGSAQVTIPDAHVSLDNYLVSANQVGYIGESRLYSGLAPTTEVTRELFQVSSGVSITGTNILTNDFESASTSGFTLTVSGSGFTASGLINSSAMQGSYHLGLAASANSQMIVEPDDVATSGITCGRAIFLVDPGTASFGSTPQAAVGFAFMRQDTSVNSNCYKAILRINNQNDRVGRQQILEIAYGPMTTSTGIIASKTNISSYYIDFTSEYVRDLYRPIWVMIEWEVLSVSAILFKIYYKLYSSGDTPTTVKNKAILTGETIFTGSTNGAALYTTNLAKVAWLLGSDSTSVGYVRLDSLYLETLSNLDRNSGINRFNLLAVNTATSSTAIRPVLTNSVVNNLGAPPEGCIMNPSSTPNIINPIITDQVSLYQKKGTGYSGMLLTTVGGDVLSDNAYGLFTFRESEASSIKSGSIRIGCTLTANASGSSDSKIALGFLRQGSSHDSNAYCVEIAMYPGTGTGIRFTLKKGQFFSTTLNDSANFIGSTLGGMVVSNVTYPDNGLLWVEVRWTAGVSSTIIEILYAIGEQGLYRIDSSPGSVDYKLTTLLSYTDSSSPYLTTSVSPIFAHLNENNSGASYNNIYSIELRRAKVGN